jgi:hypothetical protein
VELLDADWQDGQSQSNVRRATAVKLETAFDTDRRAPAPHFSIGLVRLMLALNQFCVDTPSILAANVCR